LGQQDQKTQEQLKELKEQQSKLQGQVPSFKEKLEAYKREFSQPSALLVSEETYIELKATPEERRSLKEFLQVRIYEVLEKYQRELESLRRENDELVE
jgi:chromosome segregation ATPase